jgi:hypothetical protein
MQVRNKYVRFVKGGVQKLQPFKQRRPAFFLVKPGVDEQVAFQSFDQVAV